MKRRINVFYFLQNLHEIVFSVKNHITTSPQQLVVLLTCCLVVFFFGRSGSAVGLSAISFSASLQKDAAPIPNALGDISISSGDATEVTSLHSILIGRRHRGDVSTGLFCDKKLTFLFLNYIVSLH